MPPAARVGDNHKCIPFHPGGPVNTGSGDVMIAGQPAARLGDKLLCIVPDTIISGSGTVMINGMPAARLGDQTEHGGVIEVGAPNVIIGG